MSFHPTAAAVAEADYDILKTLADSGISAQVVVAQALDDLACSKSYDRQEVISREDLLSGLDDLADAISAARAEFAGPQPVARPDVPTDIQLNNYILGAVAHLTECDMYGLWTKWCEQLLQEALPKAADPVLLLHNPAVTENTPADLQIIEQASKKWESEGELEIDEPTLVSGSDDGAYVLAWVWVYHEKNEDDEDDEDDTVAGDDAERVD